MLFRSVSQSRYKSIECLKNTVDLSCHITPQNVQIILERIVSVNVDGVKESRDTIVQFTVDLKENGAVE